MLTQRNHLLILGQGSSLDLLVATFPERGISWPSRSASWCHFHEWQVSTAEMNAWHDRHPEIRGIWLALEPGKVSAASLNGEPGQLEEMSTATSLAQRLAEALAIPWPPMQAALSDSERSPRAALPVLLAAAGLPQIMGNQLPKRAQPSFQPGSPRAQIVKLCAELEPVPLASPLQIERRDAPIDLFFLAWLISDQAAPVLEFRLPGKPDALTWPEVATSRLHCQGPLWELSFDQDATPFGMLHYLADAWERLEPNLPPGTHLDMKIAPLALDNEDVKTPNPGAIQRYCAILRPDYLELVSSCPQVAVTRLQQALALSCWVRRGGCWTVATPEEAAALRLDAQKEHCIEGKDITWHPQAIEVAEYHQRAFLARRFFRRHFADCWDLQQSLALDATCDQAIGQLKNLGQLLTARLAKPKTTDILFEGRSGRFWRADPTALPAHQQQLLEEYTSYFGEQGFLPLVEIVWEPGSDVLLKILVNSRIAAYGAIMLGLAGLHLECISYLENGAILTTTSVPDLKDYPEEQIYRFYLPGLTLVHQVAAHQKHCSDFCEQYQTSISPVSENISEILLKVDHSLLRQLAAKKR